MATSSSHPNQDPSASADNTTLDAVVVSSDAVVPEVVPSVFDGQGDGEVRGVDVVDVNVTPNGQPEATSVSEANPAPMPESPVSSSSPGGALAAPPGSFSSFLAPLNKEKFAVVVKDVEEKLKVVQSTLSMMDSLNDSEGFDATLK